jgi:hypothetical protein
MKPDYANPMLQTDLSIRFTKPICRARPCARQTLRRWTPTRSSPEDQGHAAPGGPPASIHEDGVRQLLAGGAGIHVDFHAHRHFDDFRCFPGHFGSPYKPDELPPWLLNYRAKKSSPVKSFAINPRVLFCCSAIVPCGIVFALRINQTVSRGSPLPMSSDLIERLGSSDLAADNLAHCHLDVVRQQRIKNL